jgi:ankyrin repeat protein
LTKYNRNGLHIATLKGQLEVAKVLLNYKIDADAYDSDGNTPLHFAAENGYKDIIEFLL